MMENKTGEFTGRAVVVGAIHADSASTAATQTKILTAMMLGVLVRYSRNSSMPERKTSHVFILTLKPRSTKVLSRKSIVVASVFFARAQRHDVRV